MFTCQISGFNEPLIQATEDILSDAETLKGSNCIINEGISAISYNISTPKCGRGEADVSSSINALDSSKSNVLETTIQENLDSYGGLREHPDGPLEFRRTLSEELLPVGGNGISGNTMPIFDLTPVIPNDIITPDISESNASSVELTDEADNSSCKPKSTEKALLSAGYTISKAKDTMSSKKKHEGVSQQTRYERNRPKTQVFSQGKVYTYDKLDIKSNNTREPKAKDRQSVN